MKTFLPRAAATALAAASLTTACLSTRTLETRVRAEPPASHRRVIKPVLAVTEFENRASFSGQWNLGHGFADVLSTELINTRRVVVLERRNLGDVLGEIQRQGSELFRPEGRAERGRLRNAQFLLRGVITDFTVSGDVSGWFRTPSVRGRLGGSSARVALNIKVSDVESGEILGSVRTEASARSGFFGAATDYRNVSFGGDAFFRTPLGIATERAIRKAVDQLLRTLPTEYWSPRVADFDGELAVLNGGGNVGMAAGEEFIVRDPARPVRDPLTGEVIEWIPGPVTGRVRVTEVLPASARAQMLTGTARRGSVLELAERPRRRAAAEN
jgi:curli biogenesis system outer membrane secretion channel CsgG